MHLANRLPTYAHKQIKNITQSRCNYDRKANNNTIERYETLVIEKKTRQQTPGAQTVKQLQARSPETKKELQTAVDKAIAVLVTKIHCKKMKL